MSNNLRVSILFNAIDRLTAPVQAIGKAVVGMGVNFARAGVSASKYGGDLSGLTGKISGVSNALDTQLLHMERVNKAQTHLNMLSKQHRAISIARVGINRQLNDIAEREQQILDKRSKMRGQLLDAGGLALTLAAPIKAAIDFESVMADVRKVVDFESPQQFGKMSSDLLNMSTVIPMAASGLGDIMAAAGQAGIARHELLRFTSDAAKMGVAFDQSGADAGAAMTGMRSIFKLNQDQVVSLADSYNYLSNTMDARASDLVEIANRSGSTAKLFGLTGEQVGALGATFKTLKTRTDVAATGINALLLRLATADKQPGKFGDALNALGYTAADLKDAIANDAQGALLDFLRAVKGSEDIMGTLSDLFGAEYSDDIAKLVGGLDIYEAALAKVADKSKYAGSMQREYETRSATTGNAVTLLANRVVRLGISIGSVLLPVLTQATEIIGSAVDKVVSLTERHPALTKAITTLAAGLIVAKIATITLGYAFTFVRGAILLLSPSYWVLRMHNIRLAIAMRLTAIQIRINSALLWVYNTALYKSIYAATANIYAHIRAGVVYTALRVRLMAMTTAQWLHNVALYSGTTALIANISGIISAGKVYTLSAIRLRAVAAAQWLLNAAMTANPIGLIIVGIGALIAGAYMLYKHWDKVTAWWGRAIGKVADKIKQLGAWWRSVFGGGGKDTKITATTQVSKQITNATAAIPSANGVSANGTDTVGGGQYKPISPAARSTTVNNSSSYNINIAPAPGMDERAIAKQVSKEIERRDREANAKQRGVLYDQAEYAMP